jgi:proline iminopeptidase
MALEFHDGFVRVLGYRIYYKSIGRPSKGTILCLHGGPGGSHWSLINMADLAPLGYRVVWYDQLGCGKSEKPKSYRNYTIERAADEAEAIRRRLHLGRVHLCGYSYGGSLALQTILSHPKGFMSLVVSSGYASTAEWLAEVRRLISRLPAKMRVAIETGEARGRFDDSRYKKAIAEFMRRHFSDLRVTPYNLTIGTLNAKIHRAMMSDPEGFAVTGNLASWNVKPKLKQIRIPTLVTVGARDLATPACARTIHRGIRGSRLVIFRKSGHDVLFKERDLYMETVRNFLENVSHHLINSAGGELVVG